MDPFVIGTGLGGLFLGVFVAYFIFQPKTKSIEETAQKEAERVRKTAELEAEKLLLDGRKQVDQLRENTKREEVQMQERITKMQTIADERIMKREATLEEKIDKMEVAKEEYEKSIEALESEKKQLDKKIKEQDEVLEKVAKLSKEEAKDELLKRVETEASKELANTLTRKIEETKKTAEEEGSNIIVQSIQRYAAPVTAESTITVVKVEDDSKGRIIGREGRNINAFELITGVDLIVDDTPGTITISSFDMFRRYVAKIALEELIKDGRIHPSKIEECVKKAQENADKLILELGQKACYDLGLSGFPEQVLKLIGRLRFRTSYGQNVLSHSMEVAYIAEALAEALPPAAPEICKKAGILHDIGKAISHEVEGGHAVIGKEILEKFYIDKKVILAMQSHHEDYPYETLESRILQAADAISASRPGARRETMEKYIKRLKELEAISSSFPGVEKTFAIQAGREVRVFVNATEMDDFKSEQLSFDIARKIESNCEYPGEVKVAVIRENRFENVAK